MVKHEKLENSLKIIHRLLLLARKMAYEKQSHEVIAEILDDIEYLPALLLEQADRTDVFRTHLLGITKKYGWSGLMDIFDK